MDDDSFVKYRKYLIPRVAFIGCDNCPQLWVQTAAQALAAPTEVVRCPACGAVKFNPDDADAPHVIDDGKMK